MLRARKLSKAELKDNDETYKGSVFLEPREWLDSAIMGRDLSTGGIIYDRTTVIECFMVKDSLSFFQASEMVDYNTERSLPYMPSPKPVLLNNDSEGIQSADEAETDGDED